MRKAGVFNMKKYNKSYRVAFFEYESWDIHGMLRRREGLNRQLDEGVFNGAELFPDVKKIRRVKWHHGWLPFAQDGCGNCLDLDPPQDGVFGQQYVQNQHIYLTNYIKPYLHIKYHNYIY